MSVWKDHLKRTLRGELTWRTCQHCQGTGFENWAEDGGDIKPGRAGTEDRCDGECPMCDGLGHFVLIDREEK